MSIYLGVFISFDIILLTTITKGMKWKMRNNELKFLANLAKQRLMQKDYTLTKEQMRNKASSYFIQNAKALRRLKAETSYVTISEALDIGFVEKVRELIDSDCYNPLGVLCDKSYFDTLTTSEKEFYILNLSDKYNRVRDKLLCG